MSEPLDWPIGPHLVHFEPSDLLVLVMRGALTAEHIDQYVVLLHSLVARHGELFVILNAAALTDIPSSTRRRLVLPSQSFPYRGFAVIGFRFATRVLIETIVTAGRRLVPWVFDFPVQFFTSEADARAWFDSMRPRRA